MVLLKLNCARNLPEVYIALSIFLCLSLPLPALLLSPVLHCLPAIFSTPAHNRTYRHQLRIVECKDLSIIYGL